MRDLGISVTSAFQSTLPVRGATIFETHTFCTLLQFQSTLPVRGATLSRYTYFFSSRFQSTLPVRGATKRRKGICAAGQPISIHAPREGSDKNFLPQCSTTVLISIHAPREGSDKRHPKLWVCQGHFNPRSP